MKHTRNASSIRPVMLALLAWLDLVSLVPAQAMPWENPKYDSTLRAAMAESRPGPEEKGWTAWLKHHEDRKRWCAEKEVDLLMIGDSIVFGWSRGGKSVWDSYYGDRKAVNIGSSGDRTYHMLWHFQNGALDGMKKRNPKVVGQALTAAEAGDGKLGLIRWREGQTEKMTGQVPVLGAYSPTAPYGCPKSEKILNQAADKLAERMQKVGYEKQNTIPRALNALGLLATGDKKYHPLLKREAEWAAKYDNMGFATWYFGYLTTFLSEYIMASGDDSVLPGLRRMALLAAKGQSAVGSWGHKFADENGRLPGYGMMNSPGAVLTIGLVLAREAGVKDPEVQTAIERSNTFLKFYIGKGAIPYGDHAPNVFGHEDNGKNGMVAVLFDQLENKEGTDKPELVELKL